jgi:hypothetical protein
LLEVVPRNDVDSPWFDRIFDIVADFCFGFDVEMEDKSCKLLHIWQTHPVSNRFKQYVHVFDAVGKPNDVELNALLLRAEKNFWCTGYNCEEEV